MTIITLIQPKIENARTLYFHRVFIATAEQVTVIERTGVQTATTDIVNENRRYNLEPVAARAEFRRLVNSGFVRI